MFGDIMLVLAMIGLAAFAACSVGIVVMMIHDFIVHYVIEPEKAEDEENWVWEDIE